jgi:hypothetical protein
MMKFRLITRVTDYQQNEWFDVANVKFSADDLELAYNKAVKHLNELNRFPANWLVILTDHEGIQLFSPFEIARADFSQCKLDNTYRQYETLDLEPKMREGVDVAKAILRGPDSILSNDIPARVYQLAQLEMRQEWEERELLERQQKRAEKKLKSA